MTSSSSSKTISSTTVDSTPSNFCHTFVNRTPFLLLRTRPSTAGNVYGRSGVRDGGATQSPTDRAQEPLFWTLLETYPTLAEGYASRYPVVIADEHQDASELQDAV